MTDNTKPEALDLADWLEAVGGGPSAKRCAALLREQHTRIAELESELEAVGAGGVSGPLMGIASPPTAQAEGWVSVEERLPAKNTEVLICFAESPLPSTGQYTGHAEDPAGWCYPKESYLWPGESEKLPDGGAPTVTHWMPIPPLPTSAEGVEP